MCRPPLPALPAYKAFKVGERRPGRGRPTWERVWWPQVMWSTWLSEETWTRGGGLDRAADPLFCLWWILSPLSPLSLLYFSSLVSARPSWAFDHGVYFYCRYCHREVKLIAHIKRSLFLQYGNKTCLRLICRVWHVWRSDGVFICSCVRLFVCSFVGPFVCLMAALSGWKHFYSGFHQNILKPWSCFLMWILSLCLCY